MSGGYPRVVAGHEHEDFARIRSAFEGELVRLRAVEERDIPVISAAFNDPDVLAFLDAVTFPQSDEGTRAWWEGGRSDPTKVAFAIETLAGELLGGCGLEQINRRHRAATLGIWLGKPHWGKGYGTDAVRTLARFGFREMNLHRITLHVHELNLRGKRAYEKVGFKEEGRRRDGHFVDGRHVDLIVMGLLAGELVEP